MKCRHPKRWYKPKATETKAVSKAGEARLVIGTETEKKLPALGGAISDSLSEEGDGAP